MASILIIDDQRFYREYLAYELQQEGYGVSFGIDTGNIREEIEAVRPDVVLIDPFYEGLCGYRVIADIKHHVPDLPVILMSTYDSFAIEAEETRADGYVIKSVDTSVIKRTIHETLGSESTQRLEAKCQDYS